MLTRTVRALAALGLVTASGCWLQSGFDAQRSGANGGETAITSATVGDLAVAWSVPVGNSPGEAVVNGGTAYVRSVGSVTALDVATGAARWTVSQDGNSAAAFAGNRLWVPTSGGACALVSLDPKSGATLNSTPRGVPWLPKDRSNSLSACGGSDALSAGGKVSTS